MIKLCRTFTKPSAYVKFGPQNIFKKYWGCVRALVHIQCVKTCTIYLVTFLSDLWCFEAFSHWKWKKCRPVPVRYWRDTTFYFYALFSFSLQMFSKMSKIGQQMFKIPCINVHAHLSIYFKCAEFGDDEDNESCSGGSNVYSQWFLHFLSKMCMHMSTLCINEHACFYIWQ